MEESKFNFNKYSGSNETLLKLEKGRNSYIIRFINNIYKLKIIVYSINDKILKYSSEFNINDFHIKQKCYKAFNNINELYNNIFKLINNKEIFITSKNETELIFKIIILINRKKEEIQFILNKIPSQYASDKEKESGNVLELIDYILISRDIHNKNTHYSKIKCIMFFVCVLLYINHFRYSINYTKIYAEKLKLKSLNRTQKYILILDQYNNKNAYSNNGYPMFDYYRKKGRKDVYYFLFKNTPLYRQLKKENNFNNIILVDDCSKYENKVILIKKAFNYILNSKLIIYTDKINYLLNIIYMNHNLFKTVYFDHGVTYFKESNKHRYLNKNQDRRIIVKVLPEYENFLKLGWRREQLYKASLARWERFNHITKKKSAILIMFTYRKIMKNNYYNFVFYKKICELLSNEDLISYLKTNKIQIFYKNHHLANFVKPIFDKNNYIKEISTKDNFSQFIDDSSLLITDYSSLSFDFMFQNKPVIFYSLDSKDPLLSKEDKIIAQDLPKKMIFGNLFNNLFDVIKKVKYYVDNNFTLENKLKKKYKLLFFCKQNIFEKLENVFDQIIKEKQA